MKKKVFAFIALVVLVAGVNGSAAGCGKNCLSKTLPPTPTSTSLK